MTFQVRLTARAIQDLDEILGWLTAQEAGDTGASGFRGLKQAVASLSEMPDLGYWASQKPIGNAIYGIAKAAVDKMSADMAHELRPHGVAVVSLYPGLVRTEAVLQAGCFDLSNSESPEFVGRVVAALASDASLKQRSGQVLIAAAVARELGVTDLDGRQPVPLTLENA